MGWRVLLYGDSLTAGLYRRGAGFAPYGTSLAEALRADKVELAGLWCCGLSSICASEMVRCARRDHEMEDPMRRRPAPNLIKLLQAGSLHLVVLMAGTNDLAHDPPPERVFRHLQWLHRLCHRLGARTVALTIPPNKFVHLDEEYRCSWACANGLLRDWATSPSAVAEGVAAFVDVEEILPWGEEPELVECWEADGLHFSPLGSARLGRGLASSFAPLLRPGPPDAGLVCPRPRPRSVEPPSGGRMPECWASGTPAAGSAVKRMLAYGDSLTAGYYARGTLFSPPAKSLGAALAEPTDIWVCGLSGLTALQLAEGLEEESLTDVTGRVGKGLLVALRDHGPFDLALLMAGTNDLGKAWDAAAVAGFVRQLHTACHAEGVSTVALTVPPSGAVQRSSRIRRKQQGVNNALRAMAAEEPAAQGKAGFAGVIDTGSLVPYDDESTCWEPDGLHYSKAGSELLGQRLAPLVAPLLT